MHFKIKNRFHTFGLLWDVCFYRAGIGYIQLFQLISTEKIRLAYEESDVRAKLQNELKSYLKVLLYYAIF